MIGSGIGAVIMGITCGGIGWKSWQRKKREIARIMGSSGCRVTGGGPGVVVDEVKARVISIPEQQDGDQNQKRKVPASLWNPERFEDLVRNSVVVQDALMNEVVDHAVTDGGQEGVDNQNRAGSDAQMEVEGERVDETRIEQ